MEKERIEKGRLRMKTVYVIIPALEPEDVLPEYIMDLQSRTCSRVVVIDDGSGEDYRGIFDRISRMDGCTVLRHGRNRGKGRALKTGFEYVRKDVKDGERILALCADCDGQHLAEDGVRLLKTAEQCAGALVLGVRDFSDQSVPWKSRLGNHISSVLFRLLTGVELQDTQTGFRAFDGSLLERMLSIPGERFEYETEVLIEFAGEGIPIITEKTQTVYVNENEGTHFHPVRDSLQVTGVLLREPARFIMVSILCALLDVGLFRIIAGTGRAASQWDPAGFRRIAAATIAARILSAAVNFMLNKNWVFRFEEAGRVRRYILLFTGLMAASAGTVYLVSSLFGIRPAAAKIFCDGVLFFLSYRVQKLWVFARRKKGGENL